MGPKANNVTIRRAASLDFDYVDKDWLPAVRLESKDSVSSGGGEIRREARFREAFAR